MTTSSDYARYRANRQDELDSAAAYRTLAELESNNPKLAQVYIRLADVEVKHAKFWENQLHEAGQEVPQWRMSIRARILCWLGKHFGPQFMVPIISSMEQSSRNSYDNQSESQGTGMVEDERSHARLLGVITSGSERGVTGSSLARMEGRHRSTSGNALRAAILGANDGLASNLSLIMGVAGAALSSHIILITGLAGLVAGACSMAMGEWLSVQNSRELYRRQLDIEAEEIASAPEEEQEELALIYESKGIPEQTARVMAKEVMSDKTRALDALSREELGINPEDLGGSAWIAAWTSFTLFSLGAIIPLMPFIFSHGAVAVITSLAASGVALFLIGVVTTLFTGRGFLYSGTRQLLIGLAAAGVTYGIGRWIGVNLTG
jgi:VIT1/CCC1 family predicted Fe2+/Mn2+ transporter